MFRSLKPSVFLALLISLSVVQGTAAAATPDDRSSDGNSPQWLSNGSGRAYLHRSTDWHRQ